MNNSLAEYLEMLDNLPGVSGHEEAVGKAIANVVRPFCDETICDSLGNVIFVKKSDHTDRKIMICAHMDEIGFVVRYIDDNGMIYFAPLGYHDERMLMGQDLAIHTSSGIILGVTGTRPAHIISDNEKKSVVPLAELYLDVGASSRKQVYERGVQIGDQITFARKGRFLCNEIYSGKSVDNRSGCAIMMEVMRRLQDQKLGANLYYVGSVMEEVGMRGAVTSANRIQPDEAIIIDVTLAGGMPGLLERDLPIKLGDGVAVKIMDWAPNNSMAGICVRKKMSDALIAVAESKGIPFQREILLNASTDAWSVALSGEGVITGVLSVPSRYIHTPSGMVNLQDMANAADLLVAYLMTK